jgi:hypothetical protein
VAARPESRTWEGEAMVYTVARASDPALYGVLAEVEALGLDLVEIRQLGPQPKITRIR